MASLFVKRPRAAQPRCVTISQDPNWPTGLRVRGKARATGKYDGEICNFATAADLHAHLTQKRLDLVRLAQAAEGAIGLRELARLAQRDVKRVHQDVTLLCRLQLLERSAAGGVLCPFAELHLDATAAACIAAQRQPATTAHTATQPPPQPFTEENEA